MRAFLAREHQLFEPKCWTSHNVVDERFWNLLFGYSSQSSLWMYTILKTILIHHSNIVRAKQSKGNKTGGLLEDFCDEHREQ